MNKNILRLISLLLSAAILLLSGIYLFPIPDGDAIFFMPTAWFYANSKGFINPLVDLACKTDPKGLCRYCFHLPLFPWILGLVSRINPTVQTVFVATTIFSVGKLWLYDKVVTTQFRDLKNYWFVYPGTLILLAFYSLPTVGRPELLSSLIILFIYTLSVRKESGAFHALHTPLLIVALGLLFSCHLTGYYFTMILLALALLLPEKRGLRYTLLYTGSLAILSLFVGLFIIWLSPNGFDTIQGILSHNPLGRVDELSPSWYIFYWIAQPSYPAIGLFLLLATYLFILNSKEELKNIVNPIDKKILYSLAGVSSLLLLVGFYKFYAKTPDRVYDLAQFFPVFLVYALSQLKRHNRKITFAFNACLFIALLLPLRTTLLFIDHIMDGKTYAAASEVLRKDFSQNEQIVGSRPLWVLCDDLTRFTEWQGDTISNPLFIIQARRPLPEFVETNGMLVHDWRTTPQRRLFSVPISNRPQGYSFSVWQLNQAVVESVLVKRRSR